MLTACLKFFWKLWRRDAGESQSHTDECTVVAEWRPATGSQTDHTLISGQAGGQPVNLDDANAIGDIDPIARATVERMPNRFMLAQRLQSVQMLNRAKRRRDETVDPRGKPVVRRDTRSQSGRRINSTVVSKVSIERAQFSTDNVIVLPVAIKADELKRAA